MPPFWISPEAGFRAWDMAQNEALLMILCLMWCNNIKVTKNELGTKPNAIKFPCLTFMLLNPKTFALSAYKA